MIEFQNKTGTESEQNQNKRVLVLFFIGAITLSLARGFWANASKTVPDLSPSTIGRTEGQRSGTTPTANEREFNNLMVW